MSREVHVRFCERLEVKSLWPTHPYIPMARGFVYLVAVMDLVQPAGSVVAPVDHDGGGVLRRGGSGSTGRTWPA